MPKYVYMLSKTIYYKYNKKTTPITIKYDIKNPAKPTGTNIKGKLYSSKYYTYAKNFMNYVDKNNQIPNYLTTKIGKMQYQIALYGFNRIIYYSQSHSSKLPSSLALSIGKTHSLNKIIPKYTRPRSKVIIVPPKPVSTSLTIASVLDAATRVDAYADKNKVLPKTVEISGKQCAISDFLYILSLTIVNLNNGNTGNIVPIDVSSPSKPSGNSIIGDMSKTTYVSLAKNTTNFIATNKQAPNYANSPLGKMQYQTLISEFSKILVSFKDSESLPNQISINVKSTDSINGKNIGDSASDSLNDVYSGESLTKYLIATKNCQVGDSSIRSLANTLTKNCKTDLEKATAIYNWVNNNVAYTFYYDTKKGAVKTLSSKSSNCVDQAHLSIALYRAAGLAARYVHGEATFSSGSRYGHVWVQVLVGNTWIVSDTTSSRNSFGVVNKWNPKTMKLKSGKVAEILF